MPDVTIPLPEAVYSLAVEIYRERCAGSPTILCDISAIVDAADRLYGRRPIGQCSVGCWSLRFDFNTLGEAIHFKLKYC